MCFTIMPVVYLLNETPELTSHIAVQLSVYLAFFFIFGTALIYRVQNRVERCPILTEC